MNLSAIAAIAYGILSIIGGITGYAKAQSKVSLILGSISGILLIIGSIAIAQGVLWGLILALVITVELISVFTIRLIKTRKFMPAGLMVVAGGVVLILLLVQLVQR